MVREERRIIPARAGFTRPERPRPGQDRDHPRSRGVYCTTYDNPLSRRGSSPLARGLLALNWVTTGVLRIIPARAGFTRRPWRTPPIPGDHPRSRGVYLWDAACDAEHRGSSPLARGLPLRALRREPIVGIIPARAGFTPHDPRRGRAGRDHPRSRGVYEAAELGGARVWGSSPLARGLPETDPERATLLGIIPARAGFTEGLPGLDAHDGDHPRSRGVYRPRGPPTGRSSGSSPLARGLRNDGHLPPICCRIIPARAGFTLLVPDGLSQDEDHPRSRGVYTEYAYSIALAVGSSPLARGLHHSGQGPEGRGRIIPARAGFTRRETQQARRSADHPRSRGVYTPTQI